MKKKLEKYIFGLPVGNVKPTVIKVLLASVAIAGIVGIVSLLAGEFGTLQIKIIITVILTSGLSVGMLIYLTTASTRYQAIGLAGIVAALISFAIGMWLAWTEWNLFRNDYEYLIKTYAFSTVAAIGFAHTCLLVRLLGHKLFTISVGTAATIGCIFMVVVLAAAYIYGENYGSASTNMIVRYMGVFGILVAIGTIIIPVWAWLQRK